MARALIDSLLHARVRVSGGEGSISRRFTLEWLQVGHSLHADRGPPDRPRPTMPEAGPEIKGGSRFPEPLRGDAERPIEARRGVLPCDDHRQLGDGVVVVVPLQAGEQVVVDVASRVGDRVGVFERHLLRVGEKRARRIVAEECLELLPRDTVSAAHGSMDVLSELAAVPRGDATIEQRSKRHGHALVSSWRAANIAFAARKYAGLRA